MPYNEPTAVYHIKQLSDKTVVALSGELDFGYRSILRAIFADVASEEIVVDLTRVQYVDSTIVSEIMRLRREKKCSLIVARESQVAKLAELLSLGTIVDVEVTGELRDDDGVVWIPMQAG